MEESEYRKEKRFQRDIKEFIKQVSPHYKELFGGFFVTGVATYLAKIAIGTLSFSLCLATCLTVALGAFLAWRSQYSIAEALREKMAPKFKVACSKETEGCRKVAYLKDSTRAAYFRLSVQAESLDCIEKCSGSLTKISKNGSSIASGETFRLTFAPSESPDTHSKTIRDGLPEYLDVIAILEDGRAYLCAKPMPASIDANSIFSEHGIYDLTIHIGGTGVRSINIRAKFHYTKNWETSVLSLADEKAA